MATTFKFWTPGKLQINEGPVNLIIDCPLKTIEVQGSNVVEYYFGPYHNTIHVGTDTVYIDDVEFTGTAAELQDQLATVFPEANSGSGGSGGAVTSDLDITDLTTAALPSADIVNLTSSNATETIDSCSGGSDNQQWELRPASGLTVTVTFTAAASAAAGDIVGPTADIELDGSKGDYIKIVKRGTKYYQIDAMNYL